MQAHEEENKIQANGAHCYNIACIFALLGNKKQATAFLNKARSLHCAPPENFIANDEDLDSLRE